MLNKMAWRNLWRTKRRTFITAFSIAFGVLLSVLFTGMGGYSYTNMINTSATMGFGHVTVEPVGYLDNPSLDKRITRIREIRQKVLRIPGVTEAIARITGQVMFATATKSLGGIFLGIDPARESLESNIFLRSMVEGKVFEGTHGGGVVVGKIMAVKLKLRLGKKLVYTATDKNGEIVSEMVRVVGIFQTGVSEVDGSVALLPIDHVRSLLQYGPTEVTLLSIFINDQRDAGKMREKVRSALRGNECEVWTWSETQADLAGMVALDSSMNYLFQFLVGLLIAAGILNTILMGVLERTREFGVMMAVGMSPGRLFRLVVMESFWLGLLGLIFGILITIPCYYYMSRVGIDLAQWIVEGTDVGGVLVDPVMKIRLYKENAMVILSGVFLLTLVAGLYPAYRAGAIPPVESLK